MRGNTMAWGVAATVTVLTLTLGGCSRGAEADEARSGATAFGFQNGFSEPRCAPPAGLASSSRPR